MLATKGCAMMGKVRRGRGPWRAVLAVCLAIGLGAVLWFAPLSFGGIYRVSAAQLHEAATTARGLLLTAQGADGAGATLTWAAMSRAEIGGAIPIYQVGESTIPCTWTAGRLFSCTSSPGRRPLLALRAVIPRSGYRPSKKPPHCLVAVPGPWCISQVTSREAREAASTLQPTFPGKCRER